jgi:hypothetical protein
VEENLVAANRMRQVSDTGHRAGHSLPVLQTAAEDMAACQGTGESIQSWISLKL